MTETDPRPKERIYAANPGIPPDVIHEARSKWVPENIMRRILTAEYTHAIEEQRNALESCPLDEVMKVRGVIQGIRKGIAIINAAEPK